MVGVSLRDKMTESGQIRVKTRPTIRRGIRRHPGWGRPFLYMVGAMAVLVCLGIVFSLAIRGYHDRVALAGKSSDDSQVVFTVAVETLTVPANAVRFASQREG